jgi:hypothetical protein
VTTDGSPSGQLTEAEGDRAHVLGYIRDVGALEVLADVGAHPASPGCSRTGFRSSPSRQRQSPRGPGPREPCCGLRGRHGTSAHTWHHLGGDHVICPRTGPDPLQAEVRCRALGDVSRLAARAVDDIPAAGPGALRCGDVAHRSTLVAVSSTQLAAQVAGHVVALRRRRHFDVPFMTGSLSGSSGTGSGSARPTAHLRTCWGHRSGPSPGCSAGRTTARAGCSSGWVRG